MPRAIGDLLTDAVPQLTDRLAELRLRRSWEAVVGPDIGRRTRPGGLAGGCLTVVVDNSPWLHELNLRQSELLARIRTRHASVCALRFTVGSLGPEPEVTTTHEASPAPTLTLSEQDRREIDEATATIPDAALAATVRRLLARARQAGAPRSRR